MITSLLTRLAPRPRLLSIDFAKPWWNLYWQQRTLISISGLYLLLDDSCNTLLPLALGWVLETKSVTNASIMLIGYLAVELLGLATYHPFVTKIYTQSQSSFLASAYTYLLGIDPIYHTKSASGIVLGKIQRTSVAYFEFITSWFDDFLPFAAQAGTVIIATTWMHPALGLFVGVATLAFTAAYVLTVICSTTHLEQMTNQRHDASNQLGAESVAQLQFIRASFASDQVHHQLLTTHERLVQAQTTLWFSHRLIKVFFVMLYFVLITLFTAFLLSLISSNSISTVMATSLVVTFLRGTKHIFLLDRGIKRNIEAFRRIKDFYQFIRTFGTQTYPVFSSECPTVCGLARESDIHAVLVDVTLAYPDQAPIFDHLYLTLAAPRASTNKLYGIIGPSGIGKTTLLSVLGGQLKPTRGNVTVNGVDIYTIPDCERQKLVAFQGQIATSIQGTVRHNLLFGMPLRKSYDDTELIGILQDVGLWTIFSSKAGLETSLEEGALTLSGGQRQRLNFANLYLRARYYCPPVILIDEPTSSLDEISERTITQMIKQLAQQSLTLVIAHRLNTLEDSVGILDFSLLDKDKTLTVYAPTQLQERSEYYRSLLAGVTNLDIGQ